MKMLTPVEMARMRAKIVLGDSNFRGLGPCWLWTGSTLKGYSRVSYRRTTCTAHRLLFECLIDDVPEGLELDHLCRVRNCVNPNHLEPVTHQENVARVPAPTHCPHGHEYTPENTQWQKGNGKGRVCATCHRANAKAYHARKRANP